MIELVVGWYTLGGVKYAIIHVSSEHLVEETKENAMKFFHPDQPIIFVYKDADNRVRAVPGNAYLPVPILTPSVVMDLYLLEARKIRFSPSNDI